MSELITVKPATESSMYKITERRDPIPTMLGGKLHVIDMMLIGQKRKSY